jgi:hypothetical protein
VIQRQGNLVVKTPVRAKKLSAVKRFEWFLENKAVQVREWYHPFVHSVLTLVASGGQVNLIIDTSKVSFCFRLVMVSVGYKGRSLPVAWTWCLGWRGHSSTKVQIALLGYVAQLLPGGVKVSLVGDCEFENPLLIEYVHFWKWGLCLASTEGQLDHDARNGKMAAD